MQFSRLKTFAILFGGITLLGLGFASTTYFQSVVTGKPLELLPMFISEMLYYYMWGVAALFIYQLVKWFPLERLKLMLSLPAHFVAGSALSPVVFAAAFIAGRWANTQSFTDVLPELMQAARGFFLYGPGIVMGLMTYWGIVAGIYIYQYAAQFKTERIKAAQLQSALLQSELGALKMQLHPHFLFNTLHSISSLLRDNPDAADEMISRLGDFLRLTLEGTPAQTQTLRSELEFLRSYLAIEEIRFQDRFAFTLHAGPDVLDATVPTLLLQPLVENAVRYAVAPKPDNAVLQLRATKRGAVLHLELEDNGEGIASPETVRRGIGLTNTAARLEKLYGNAAQFTLANVKGGGLLVTIDLPLTLLPSVVSEPLLNNRILNERITPELAALIAPVADPHAHR